MSGRRARVLSATAVFPDRSFSREEVKVAMAGHFRRHSGRELRAGLFDHSGVERRHLSFPLEYYLEGPPFSGRNRDWLEVGLSLGEAAIRTALEAAGVAPGEVGHLLFVTTTGLATPSLDALLAARLDLPVRCLRTPIFGVGCAGGAVGLSRAASWAGGASGRVAVLLSVELCGQTFLARDMSMTNLVGTALFGDGVAAAVIANGDLAGDRPGLDFTATGSELLPDTTDLMGWDFTDEGFRLILSKEVPTAVREVVAPRLLAWIESQGHSPGSIAHWIVHPGGPRVLDAYRASFGLPGEALRWTRDVLRDRGNLSSATVLVALSDFLARAERNPGDAVLLSAVGPGFAMEQILLAVA